RVVKPGHVFNRIHGEDIAAVLLASIARPNPGRAYNLADDEPAPGGDVIAYAARLLGVPVPPEVDFDAAGMSPMARSFYAECKRVSNRRVKEELGVQLAYPDYRSGLAAILAAGGWGFDMPQGAENCRDRRSALVIVKDRKSTRLNSSHVK